MEDPVHLVDDSTSQEGQNSDGCAWVCNQQVAEYVHISVGLCFSIVLFALTLWRLFLAPEESIDMISTFTLALFQLFWKFARAVAKKAEEIDSQEEGAQSPKRQHLRNLRFFQNTASFSLCAVCMVIRVLYDFNFFGDYQNACYKYCCDCSASSNFTVCRTAVGDQNQFCTPDFQIPCSDYVPRHPIWNALYTIPAFLYLCFIVVVLLYSCTKKLGPIKNCFRKLPPMCYYTAYCVIVRTLFILILYRTEFCDTPLLGFLILYSLLMIDFKGDIIKDLESNAELDLGAIQKESEAIPSVSPWLHFLLNAEMFLVLGSIGILNSLYKPATVLETSEIDIPFKSALIGFMIFAEVLFSCSVLFHRSLHGCCGSVATNHVSFYLTLLLSVGLATVSVYSSVVLSIAQEQSIQIVAIYCLAVLLMLWKVLKSNMVFQNRESANLSNPKTRVSPQGRILKLFLCFTLFAYFLVLTTFKVLYMLNYFADYQDPCKLCCNCSATENMTLPDAISESWCQKDKTGLLQNCSADLVIPCDTYNPLHDPRLVYLAPGLFYLVFVLLVLVYYHRPRSLRRFNAFWSRPNKYCNNYAVWIMTFQLVQLLTLKACYLLVSVYLECNTGFFSFVLIYALLVIELKSGVRKEISYAGSSAMQDYLDTLLQMDVGLTILVTVIPRESWEVGGVPVDMIIWLVILFQELLYWSLIFTVRR